MHQRFLRGFDPTRHPQLVDALFTGCSLTFANHSVTKYTHAVGNDIKDIVRCMPGSLHSRMGTLLHRQDVPALGAACFNPNIPIHMIEWLLEHGANPNETVSCISGHPKQIRIVDVLTYEREWCTTLTDDRADELLSLFEKYGATPTPFERL